MKLWIGVDLDGTLAEGYPSSPDEIGPAVLPMVTLVRQLLSKGMKVKIFTARVCGGPKSVAIVQDWCQQTFGVMLPVTNVKDYHCLALLDDKAFSVATNHGRLRTFQEQERFLADCVELAQSV